MLTHLDTVGPLVKPKKRRMGIRSIVAVAVTAVLCCGCSSLDVASAATGSDQADIRVVDVEVEVKELPGLFQVSE